MLEDYPKLKGHSVVKQLMNTLTSLENELTLYRGGYNDAVEIYNARIQAMPDVLFAKRCGFTRMDFIAV